MKQTYNLRTLVSVKVTEKRQEKQFKYQTAKKSFFGDRQEGFVHWYSSAVYTKAELEKGCFLDTEFFVENFKVYYRPFVTLAFINGDKKHLTSLVRNSENR